MECVVTKPFHLRRRGRIEPSGDPKKPTVVELSRPMFDRFASLGCVVPKAEHDAKLAAEAEATRFVEEANASAERERDALLAAELDAPSEPTVDPAPPKRFGKRR